MMTRMRTTVNIDDRLLAEVKVLAAREHRTIGSVVEDALRALLESGASSDADHVSLPTFEPKNPALRAGVDLEDREAVLQVMEQDGLVVVALP